MADQTILLGAHMSIQEGFAAAVHNAEKTGASAMQIFTKSNRMWHSKPIDEGTAQRFKAALKHSTIKKVVVHASYLINLASANDATRKKSLHALQKELERCDILDIPYLVLHPGAHTGTGIETGLTKIISGIEEVYAQYTGQTDILIETAAGQGTQIGATIEEISKIINTCKVKHRLGLCLDTCHLFAAGYDIRTVAGYEALCQQIKQSIGLNKVKVIHLNDSKTNLGSHRDRHEKIGKGHIPLKIFTHIMRDSRFANIPKILETPIENDAIKEYCAEIKMLMCEIKK